ncbi:MAG: hypothetical protein COB02_04475 [Candidatus Cloacimonadota bacterium]|nr:MAG: hypothetical protein COB02_04475 [Candidatus Cloacimonadota bacterium]
MLYLKVCIILQNSLRHIFFKQSSSNKGVVIFVAVFVIGIVAVIAAIYSYTTRHSKLSSRRMFYGETIFFVAESALDEAFLKLQLNPDLVKQMFDSPNEFVAITFSLDSMELDSISESNVTPKDIKVIGKAIIIDSALENESHFMSPDEKVGVIELVVTSKLYAGGFRSGRPTTRQVTGRRNFKYIHLTGASNHTNYVLFIKHKQSPTPITATSENNLTIEPGPTGRIYLGTEDNKDWEKTVHTLSPLALSDAEKSFLELSGFSEDSSLTYSARLNNVNQTIGDSDQLLIDSSLFLDSLLWAPNIQNKLITSGSMASLNNRQKARFRGDLRFYVRDYLKRDDSNSIKISLEIGRKSNSNNSLNLGITANRDDLINLEGNVLREFNFDATNEYIGEINGVSPSRDYMVNWKTDQRTAISPSSSMVMPLYDKMPDVLSGSIASAKEKEKLRFTPYRKSSQYSYVYTEKNGISAWENFKKEQMIEYIDGKTVMKIDGVMVIVGEINFEEGHEITYEGKGVLLALKGINIASNIKKRSMDDQLILVTRGVRGSFSLVNDIEVDAFLMGHKLGTGNQKVSLIGKSRSTPFKINGGLSVDKLDVNNLPAGSSLVYDSFYASEFYHLSLAYPIHYFKVDNREKQKMMKESPDGI